MEQALSIPGFTKRQISYQAPGFWRGGRLFVDGQPAPRGSGGKRGWYVVRNDDGNPTHVQISAPFGMAPRIVVEGQAAAEHQGADTRYLVVIPFVMAAFGGLVGGAFGGLACGLLWLIARSKLPRVVKSMLSVVILITAIVGSLVVGLLIRRSIS